MHCIRCFGVQYDWKVYESYCTLTSKLNNYLISYLGMPENWSQLAIDKPRYDSCPMIGHLRVSPGLCFKTRLSAQPLIHWKSSFILMQIKLIFTRKVVHLASFWKSGFLELGSGLLEAYYCSISWEYFYFFISYLCNS